MREEERERRLLRRKLRIGFQLAKNPGCIRSPTWNSNVNGATTASEIFTDFQ